MKRAVVALLVAGLALVVPARLPAADPATPAYLPYAEFAPDDTPRHVALKQLYNQAVQRYNEVLYDYLVTLERHDRLVDLHNRSIDAEERERARNEARPLRQQLEALRRTAAERAAAVTDAERRAKAAGVPVP